MLVANELLDALAGAPGRHARRTACARCTSQSTTVARTDCGDRLRTVEGPPSTPALAEYLDRLGVTLEPGWRVEINLRAVEWIRDAARRLRRGFIILIDYGHEARELYSADALGRHADDVRAAHERRPRIAARRAAVAASTPASRTSPRTSTSPACARPPKPKA